VPSAIAWIDYDAAAQQRTQRILSLFSERETRDELGLGPIRDAFSDHLFPGTSTIHTRLRYMLFIPWIYQRLEAERVPSARIADRARRMELDLIDGLVATTDDADGIIGRYAGRELATLPSTIYWAGLGAWGIRLTPSTQAQYHQQLDAIYRRRARLHRRRQAAREREDDPELLWDTHSETWHPGLPALPEDFSERVDFALTAEEADFLTERILQTQPRSLLAHLARAPKRTAVEAVWEHPDQATFTAEHHALVGHARRFSLLAHGAALLYNLMLAEKRADEALIADYRQHAGAWLAEITEARTELRAWQRAPEDFWQALAGTRHIVPERSARFVERWLERVVATGDGVFDDPRARRLVRDREIEKKKGYSRFNNPRMLEQWSGASSLVRMRYRWPLVQSYLRDFAAARRTADTSSTACGSARCSPWRRRMAAHSTPSCGRCASSRRTARPSIA